MLPVCYIYGTDYKRYQAERQIDSAQVYQQIFDDLNLAQDYLTNYVRKGDGRNSNRIRMLSTVLWHVLTY